MIFSDATLHAMTESKPKNTEELLAVPGIGQHKSYHYGSHFLKVLQEFSELE